MTIDSDISSSLDLFGKTVDDLQENIVIGDDNVISGTLKYVSDYTGFSGKADEQSGNYIALHADVPNVDGVTYNINGSTLDSDQTIVLIVKDNSKKVRVTASKAGYDSITKEYSLNGLTLESEE